MEQTIHVLLIDDKDIVREGWARALQDVKEIHIAHMTTRAVTEGQLPKQSPDMLLMTISTFCLLDSKEIISHLVRTYPLVRTMAICGKKDKLEMLHTQGVDKIIQSPIEPQKLADNIIGLFRDDEHFCERYDVLLKGTLPGPKDAYSYEELMTQIIRLLFREHLTNAKRQSKTILGTERRDCVFFNHSNHPFWDTLRIRYTADQILFEFKNTEISIEHINQILAYMEPPMGHFGILTGRQSIRKQVLLKILIAHRAEKMVLTLCDDDIHVMLAYKAAGIEPTEYLQLLYNDLIRQIQ